MLIFKDKPVNKEQYPPAVPSGLHSSSSPLNIPTPSPGSSTVHPSGAPSTSFNLSNSPSYHNILPNQSYHSPNTLNPPLSNQSPFHLQSTLGTSSLHLPVTPSNGSLNPSNASFNLPGTPGNALFSPSSPAVVLSQSPAAAVAVSSLNLPHGYQKGGLYIIFKPLVWPLGVY